MLLGRLPFFCFSFHFEPIWSPGVILGSPGGHFGGVLLSPQAHPTAAKVVILSCVYCYFGRWRHFRVLNRGPRGAQRGSKRKKRAGPKRAKTIEKTTFSIDVDLFFCVLDSKKSSKHQRQKWFKIELNRL